MQMPVHIVAALGFVENDQEEILIVKDRHSGEWVFPGGQVKVGENLVDGLIREVKEESGIEVEISHLTSIYSNTGTYEGHSGVGTVPTKVMFDLVCISKGGELTTSEETSDSRWVGKEEVLHMVTAQALRTRYEAYLNFKGTINYMDYVTRPHFELKLKRDV